MRYHGPRTLPVFNPRCGSPTEVNIVERQPHTATNSVNSRSFGAFMVLAGVIITFGTYGTGIVLGLPLVLLGLAFPAWHRARLHRGEVTRRPNAKEGLVMTRDEADRKAHRVRRKAREASDRYELHHT